MVALIERRIPQVDERLGDAGWLAGMWNGAGGMALWKKLKAVMIGA